MKKRTLFFSLTVSIMLAASVIASSVHYFLGAMAVSAAPTGLVIQASPPSLNALNQTYASFSFTSGGTVGYPYQYTVSTGGTVSNVTSGTLGSDLQIHPAFNVLTITTGGTANRTGWIPAVSTLLYSASLADNSGNWSTIPGTCSVSYNANLLSGYTSGQTPNDPNTRNASTGGLLIDSGGTASPIYANITGGSMTIVSVSGGTAATTSFGISGGTLAQVTAISSGTLTQIPIEMTAAFGCGSLNVSGSAPLCLTGTAATSYPCSKVVLCATGSGGLVGSSTGSQPFSIPPNSPLTLGSTNANALFLSGGTTTVGYWWWR